MNERQEEGVRTTGSHGKIVNTPALICERLQPITREADYYGVPLMREPEAHVVDGTLVVITEPIIQAGRVDCSCSGWEITERVVVWVGLIGWLGG